MLQSVRRLNWKSGIWNTTVRVALNKNYRVPNPEGYTGSY